MNSIAPPAAHPPAPPCGLPRRLLAMLYDTLLVIALLMLAGALALPFTGADAQALRDPFYTAYLLLVWFAYFGGCWSALGQTLGMRAWNIRIETKRGTPPGWGAVAVRFMVALASAALLGLGFFAALVDAQRRTWHDRASHTRLVRIAPA